MSRRGALGAVGVGVSSVAWGARGKTASKPGWRSLWNGRDFGGWETWLGVPHKTVAGLALPRNAQGEYTDVVGLNQDPLGVYSIVKVDGKPAIRISGQIYGALTTLEELESYHLRFEFKWGTQKWEPRLNAVRDSGLCYSCHGEHGHHGKAWMRSLELQVQEHDVGDYWGVGPVVCEIRGKRTKDVVTYAPDGEPFQIPSAGVLRRAIKGGDGERPTGQWNLVELYAVGDAAVHVVNGKKVLALTRARKSEGQTLSPLTRGKLQLQSEGAEIFYRNIAVRPIEEFPTEHRP
jgi:hypothetical protein